MTEQSWSETVKSDPPFRFGTVILGLAMIGSFIGAFGAWSNLAPIESAVVAQGIVSVESGVQNVEHFEGGIVQDILVSAGDFVAEGQVLIRMQNTEAFAQLNDVQSRYFEALAIEARLKAEMSAADRIVFPEYLTRKIGDRAAQAAMVNQRAIFAGRRKLLAERLDILEKTQNGLRAEIEGLLGQVRSNERKVNIVEQELDAARKLWERKLVPRTRILALEREQAELEGEGSQFRAAIGSAEQGLAEATLRMAELRSLSTTEIAEELREVGAEAYRLKQQIAAAQDVINRTEVRSPTEGVIVKMNVATIGGVISQGEAVVSVLPSNDNLIVQTKIDPLDIDRVSEGLKTSVWLTSLNRRTQSGIEGVVQSISADRLTDQTGKPYYLARVVMDASDIENSSVPLQAGMGAEVMIRTGTQTAMNYITAPISRYFSRALLEN